MEIVKPSRLDALTGLRCFAAINIVLFHFSNPDWFDFQGVFRLPGFRAHPVHLGLDFAPVVNAGYASVSFFILLSGFVLAYNYASKARAGHLSRTHFWEARFTRLYPIYLLSLILSWRTIPGEYLAHTHTMFWAGMVLSPLLLQGWIPEIATFLNTPAWTMSAESAYYLAFPWIARWKRPARLLPHLAKMAGVWCLGMIPGTLYWLLNPDHLVVTDRWSSAPWLQALKYTPLPHLASFVFGVMLASVDELLPRAGWLRLVLGIGGFVGTFGILTLGPIVPYAIVHDGLLMPFFGSMILGLAGQNLIAKAFSLRLLVFVGEASYCLYLLHFNLWNLIHDSGILERTGLIRFDPWISYVLLIGLALVALHLIEKPAQRLLRRWMGVTPHVHSPKPAKPA